MAWLFLVIASFGEIFGVICINLFLNTKKWHWLLAIVAVFGGGFFFLALAMKDIPLGTAYAVWTGLGATGAVLSGIIFFHEKANAARLFFLACIISGAVGLKILN